MGFTDYLTSTTYVAGKAAEVTLNTGRKILELTGIIRTSEPELRLPKNLQDLDVSKFVKNQSLVVQVAAVSGAVAVVFAAYGAHTLSLKEDYEERKLLLDIANRHHFFHTLAVLGAPLSRFPKTTAVVMASGMLLFCGTCYYQAFTGNTKLKFLTPVGGTFLILGWLCMAL